MEERRRWTLAGAACAVVVFVVRLAVSWGRQEYAIWPDEPAQLAIARFVGGGTRWNMHNHSIWRPMFGTLLAPVYWFTDDPVSVLHVALLLNAVLGGISAWLLVFLARRLTSMQVAGCVSASLLISLSPAVLFTTDFVFAESLVLPLYMATLWCLLRYHELATPGYGIAAGILAALAFGTHSRMLPLTVVVIGVAVDAAVRRRGSPAAAGGVVVVAVAAAFSMSVYTSYLVDRLWNEPSTRNSIGGVLEQLTNGPSVLVSLAGQSWTLCVSSAGVVVYGTFVLVRAAVRRGGERVETEAALPSPGDARIVLVVFAFCASLSVVFMADRWRSDQVVYGRYNAAVVAPLLIVGLAALMRSLQRRRVGVLVGVTSATTAALGGVVWALRHDLLRTDNGLEPMILGLQPFMVSATAIDVPAMTLWALAAIGTLGGVAVLFRSPRWRAGAVVGVAAVGVLVGSARTRSAADRWNGSGDARSVQALRADVLTDGVPVDYYLPQGSNATVPMMLYQFYLPETPVTVVADPIRGASDSYVFAPIDNQDLAASGADLVWTDQRRSLGLWRR